MLGTQVNPAHPAIDGMLVEPIRIAREHATSQRGGDEFPLFIFDQRTLAGAQILENFRKGSLPQKKRFLARLRAGEKLF